MQLTPAYSHGTSVPGTATGAGLPISLLSATGGTGSALLRCFNRGTANVSFRVEQSSSALNTRLGTPAANSWQTIPLTWKQDVIILQAGEDICLPLDDRGPWVRTYITAVVTGGQLESSVSLVHLDQTKTPVSAQNPTATNAATEGM